MDKMKLVFDSLNRLDVSAVPIVLFVDQHGVIRKRNPKPKDIDEFLKTDFESPVEPAMVKIPSRPGDVAAMDSDFESAIKQYRTHLKANPKDARSTFRLGVCYRKRFDERTVGSVHDAADFTRAVDHWQAALALNPNQYIWRRRLQQYGPVLSKPYPFYDWVAKARTEIAARGETPHELSAEPSGAELVGPKRNTLPEKKSPVVEPDPTGQVDRDSQGAITIQSAVVLSTERKKTARIHLMMHPSGLTKFQWNNEVEPVRIWWNSSPSVLPSQQLIEIVPSSARAGQATSDELRSTEFEVSWGDSESTAAHKLTGYAVYHLCNKSTGACVFRRQDISIDILPAK